MTIYLDKKKFPKLVKFLRENHSWPERYQKFAVSNACFGCRSGKSKLKAVFRSALQSNNSGGLELHAQAANRFAESIDSLPNRGRVVAGHFLSCFGAGNMDELFASLIRIKGVGGKKAALFMRDLFVTQDLPRDDKIFEQRFICEQDLFIPLDVVIASVLSRVSKPAAFKEGDDLGKAFAPTNKFFKKRLRNNHMIIEDLWFWGYFGLRTTKTKIPSTTGIKARTITKRIVELNSDKLTMDPYFSQRKPPTQTMEKFCDLIR